MRGNVPTRRFGIEQLSSKGRVKIRVIDDCAENNVNELCTVIGRIRMGSLARVIESARHVHRGRDLVLWKTDFKAAYRCLPVAPDGYYATTSTVYDPEVRDVKTFVHYALPFGHIAAVYAWDRVGHALSHVIDFWCVAISERYVDDIFGIDFAESAVDLVDFVMWLCAQCGFFVLSLIHI